MVTSRGWWFLTTALILTIIGTLLSPRGLEVIPLLGLTLLAWFSLEWLLFLLRIRLLLPALLIKRQVRDAKRVVPLLWANRDFTVQLTIENPSIFRLPYVLLSDRPPLGAQKTGGDHEITMAFQRYQSQLLEYQIRTLSPGEIRFEGIALEMADLQGFFYYRTFLRTEAVFPVLPPLTDEEGKQRSNKTHNLLPPPGVHLLRRSGGGGDLHDLRDYIPGDPPKMIAWKPSARRDRLITKELETEVPVRCTIFLDTSQSVRFGLPGQTMLHQLTMLASGIAQSTLLNRDLVGLTILDESTTAILPPSRDSQHLIRMLHQLAKAATKPPISPEPEIDSLVRLATPLALELYPDLLRKDINRLPFLMFWDPSLDSRWGWLIIALLATPLLLLWQPLTNNVGLLAYTLTKETESLRYWLAFAGIGLFLPMIGLLFWFWHGIRGQFAPRQPHRMRRKRLSALLSTLDQAPLGQLAEWMENDQAFGIRLQQFLAHHQVRYPITLYDEQGQYLFHEPHKLEILAKAMQKAVTHAQDNELFVLLVDLLELDEHLDPVLRSVKVAMARHHDVIVIAPWLAGIPKLKEEVSEQEDPERWKVLLQESIVESYQGVQGILMRETVFRYHRAYQKVKRAFQKIGVLVITVDEGEPIRLVQHRMSRLQGVRNR